MLLAIILLEAVLFCEKMRAIRCFNVVDSKMATLKKMQTNFVTESKIKCLGHLRRALI